VMRVRLSVKRLVCTRLVNVRSSPSVKFKVIKKPDPLVGLFFV
jgi:hypothetical protein